MQALENAGALIKGASGRAFAEGVEVQADDIVIEGKPGSDAFAGRYPDLVLRSQGITTIALVGQPRNISLESTMRAAYDKGYRVLGITDAGAAIGLEQYGASNDSVLSRVSRV